MKHSSLKRSRILSLLWFLIGVATFSAVQPAAVAQSLPQILVATYSGTLAASPTPGNTVVGTGQVDVFGGRLSVTGGALNIANEGSLSFYRDFDYFSAAAASNAQKYVVDSSPGSQANVTVAACYDPATGDSYVIDYGPGANQFDTFKITGNPAGAYQDLGVSAVATAAWNSTHQYRSVVSVTAIVGGSRTITAALFDLTALGTSPVNVTDAGALITKTWTDSTAPLTGNRFALVSSYSAGSAYTRVALYGDGGGAAPTPTLAAPSVTATTGTTVSLTVPPLVNGTGTVAYEMHRSQTAGFIPSSSDRLDSPMPGTTYTDSPPFSVYPYYYKGVATDSASTPNVVTSLEATAVLASSPYGLSAGFLGTSETWGSGAGGLLGTTGVVGGNPQGSFVSATQAALSGLGGVHSVTCYNQGVVGSVSGGWVAGSGQLNTALAAFPAGCIVHGQFGKNDSKVGTPSSKAQFKANILSMVGAVVAAGHPIVLSYEWPVVPGAGGGQWNEASNDLIRQYNQAISEICAADTTGMVFLGDTSVFGFISVNMDATWLGDGIHGTDKMYAWYGNAVARVLAPHLGLATPPALAPVTALSASDEALLNGTQKAGQLVSLAPTQTFNNTGQTSAPGWLGIASVLLPADHTAIQADVAGVPAATVSAMKADATLARTFNRSYGKYSYNASTHVMSLLKDDGTPLLGSDGVTPVSVTLGYDTASGTITSKQ